MDKIIMMMILKKVVKIQIKSKRRIIKIKYKIKL
jgi:hypothetical protein